MATNVHHSPHLFDRDVGLSRDLLGRWLTLELLRERLLDVAQTTEHVDHVHRNANCPGLVGDGPRDRLTNPPGGICRELEATAVLVLVDSSHQPGVAFLDQIQEAQAAIAIFLGDRNHQP